MPYSENLPNVLTPQWMRRPTWFKWWAALGAVLDVLVTTVKNAVKARFPSVLYAATDSLDAIGGERLLPRARFGSGPESDASFAARLFAAWQIWYWAGTAYGLLTALKLAGYPTSFLETVGGYQYTLDAFGNLITTPLVEIPGLIGTWMTRYDRHYWSEFSVMFSIPNLPTPGTGAVSDWTIALPAADSSEIANLITTIKRWRPGFARCAGITAITAGRAFGYPLGLTFGGLAGLGYDLTSNRTTTFPVD